MSILALLVASAISAKTDAPKEFTVETSHASWVFGSDGVTRQFIDKSSQINYAATAPAQAAFARVLKEGKWFPATSASLENGQLVVDFGLADATAVILE